jgi:hypothetical protein
VVNAKHFSQVEPVKKKYNPDNGFFLAGTNGYPETTPDSLGGYHYAIFVSHSNLKPERHLRTPLWLKNRYPGFSFKDGGEGPEWDLPTDYYLNIIKGGKPGEYQLHGHCLAWINMSPKWMMQIIPENTAATKWNTSALFYVTNDEAEEPFLKTDKDTARRIQFNHIIYEMRHFMTTDTRYGSSEKRGIIPFLSFEVVNS